MKIQLTELLTNYSEIGGIWFDGHWDHIGWDGENWRELNIDLHYDENYPLIYELQPAALIFIRNVDHPLVSARYLDSGKEVKFKQIEEGLFLYLDEDQLHPIDTILELEFEPENASAQAAH